MAWILLTDQSNPDKKYYIACELPFEGKDSGGRTTIYSCRRISDPQFGNELRIPYIEFSEEACKKDKRLKNPEHEADIIINGRIEGTNMVIPIGRITNQEISLSYEKKIVNEKQSEEPMHKGKKSE